MQLDDFRNQVLLNPDEERVEVNQRLLIDKILARYSSEFTVYRELMQNSDDAESSSIEIRFETKNNEKVTRILFKNNGFAFRDEDWKRLKKIAEGNPDVQKIGAFGVGFYSLFSVCEDPFVFSDGRGMAFYWRGNQLYTKQATGDRDITWKTTFLMDMREPIEFPDVEKLARFLANSLGFTGNLREVSVYFNDTFVLQLSKKNVPNPRSIDVTAFNTFSPQRMFHLTSADVRGVRLDVKRLLVPTNISARQLCLNKYQVEDKSIFLRVASGNLDVEASDEFAAEMERITKKRLPNRTSIQIIFTGFDDESGNKNISPVFKDLLPYPDQGKIYIGFPTHQTTGCCSHLAARLIPTVERESIDLVDPTLAKYNSEMLLIAGTLCRILYENEMARITELYNDYDRKRFEEWAAYALRNFTFNQSTPNEQVSVNLESQFFNCKNELSILSTNGVFPIPSVRIPNTKMAGFIKKVPTVPKVIFEQCDTFFKKAKDKRLIEDLTLQDVLCELERQISEDELIELLKWWISYRSEGNDVTSSEFTQFMQLAHIGNQFRPLNTIRYVLNPGIIPTDVDIPDEVLPYTISRNLERRDLEKWLRWSELSLVNWTKFIVNKPDLETNPTFAKKVHQVLTKNLNNTSRSNKDIIRQLLVQKRCIPTDCGMEFPNKAYFESVNLFPNLPTIQFEKPSSVRNLMELLGVRKVVELELIFDRLNSQSGQDCNHIRLAKYLASKSNDLKENEKWILREKPIWPKENSITSPRQRFIARNLYVPLPLHRKFGLPVIDWNGRWSRNAEGKFLIELGLQEYPPLDKILELAALPTVSEIHKEALKYFIHNFDEKYSRNYNSDKVNIAFLPCSDNNYAKPSECFIDPRCKIMDFQVIRQDLQYEVGKFGVRQRPNNLELLKRLTEDPPRDNDNAKAIFEYLASRETEFTDSDWNTFADLKFIPIQDRLQPDVINFADSHSCFLKVQEEMLENFFSYVNFGEKANKFLQSCGVKDKPSSVDLLNLLIRSSRELWNSIDDKENYLSILRKIAIDFSDFGTRSSLIAKMKEAPILVAIKKISDSFLLASAKEIFINDNKLYQQIFNQLTAPEDDFLEMLYKELGCRSLQESVKENSIQRGIIRENENSRQLQKRIAERANLFYFSHPGNKKKDEENKVIRDEKWLKELKVREIDYIDTTYTLTTTREVKSKRNKICILQNSETWTLYVSPDSFDANLLNFDISQHIIKSIYKSHEWKDIFYLNTLLTTPLEILRNLGYPVDRRNTTDS